MRVLMSAFTVLTGLAIGVSSASPITLKRGLWATAPGCAVLQKAERRHHMSNADVVDGGITGRSIFMEVDRNSIGWVDLVCQVTKTTGNGPATIHALRCRGDNTRSYNGKVRSVTPFRIQFIGTRPTSGSYYFCR